MPQIIIANPGNRKRRRARKVKRTTHGRRKRTHRRAAVMASTKRTHRRRRRAVRHHGGTHRRVTRRRRARRNPGLGGLHLPSTNRIIGGVAAAVGGPMLAGMLFKNVTDPNMRMLGTAGGGLAIALAAGMFLGRDAGEAAATVAVAIPIAGMVAGAMAPKGAAGTHAGYTISDTALDRLGALPDGFAEPLSGLEDVSRFAFASDED